MRILRPLPTELQHFSQTAEQLLSTEPRLPFDREPILAHLYIGMQAILGACDLFGYAPPITPARYRQFRDFTKQVLAPNGPIEETAEHYNRRQLVFETGVVQFFSQPYSSAYFDEACLAVASGGPVSLAEIGLIVENSRFGRPGGGFVADDLRFPRSAGFLGIRELTGAEVGSSLKRRYARRIGYAASLAAYKRQERLTPKVAAVRLRASAMGSLAVEYSLKAVAHAKHLAEKQNTCFIPSPVEAYHLNRLARLIAPKGELGSYRNEVSADYMESSQNLLKEYGWYANPERHFGHGDTSSFYTDLHTPPKPDAKRS